jgi:Uncharacterized conserved protein
MRLEGNETISTDRESLFEVMIDAEVLKRCIPGCELLEQQADGSYKMSLKAGVGSIRGVFTGTIRLEEIRAPEHYKMIVEGKGTSGFVKGIGEIDLAVSGEQTIVTYAGDVNVGGTIASVGQRVIQTTAKIMTSQFFTAIGAEAKARAENSPPPKQGVVRNALRSISDKFQK